MDRLQPLSAACLSEKSDKLDRDHCIKAVAVALRDANLCQQITGKQFEFEYQGKKVQLENPPKMECLTQVAAATNNPSLCDQVVGVLIAASKIDCLYRVAAANHNPSICDRIGNEEQSRVGILMNKAGCKAQVGKVPPQESSQVSPQEKPVTETEGIKPKSECKYDADCQPICEGNVRFKMGCDSQTDTCQKTFSDDCAALKDTIGELSISKICQNGECVSDTKAIDTNKAELNAIKVNLSDQVKKWTADRQEITQMMLDANKKCLSGLADVTNKLIIDTALKLAHPPKSLLSIASYATTTLIDKISKDPNKMSAEEFISWNCNMYKSLQTDLDVLEKKINQAQDQYRQINSLLGI